MPKSTNHSKIKKLVESAIAKVLSEDNSNISPPPKPKSSDYPFYSDYEAAEKEWQGKHSAKAPGSSAVPKTAAPVSKEEDILRTLAPPAVPAETEDFSGGVASDPDLPDIPIEQPEVQFTGEYDEEPEIIRLQKAAIEPVTDPQEYQGTQIGYLPDALADFPGVRLAGTLVGDPKEEQRSYGTQEVAQMLKAMAHEGGGELDVGDCSQYGGGDVSHHGGHELGTECDIALPRMGGGTTFNEPPQDDKGVAHWRHNKFSDATPDEINTPKLTGWLRTLGRAGVHKVFLDQSHIDRVHAHADELVALGEMSKRERTVVDNMLLHVEAPGQNPEHKDHIHIKLHQYALSARPGQDRPGATTKMQQRKYLQEDKQVSRKRLTEIAKKAIVKILKEDVKKTKIREEVIKAMKKVLTEQDLDALVAQARAIKDPRGQVATSMKTDVPKGQVRPVDPPPRQTLTRRRSPQPTNEAPEPKTPDPVVDTPTTAATPAPTPTAEPAAKAAAAPAPPAEKPPPPPPPAEKPAETPTPAPTPTEVTGAAAAVPAAAAAATPTPPATEAPPPAPTAAVTPLPAGKRDDRSRKKSKSE